MGVFSNKRGTFSATIFYKSIQDPINLTQARGSAGIFQYENTGEKASVLGIELEGRINLIENDDEKVFSLRMLLFLECGLVKTS